MPKKTLEQHIAELEVLQREMLLGCVMLPLQDFKKLLQRIKRKERTINELEV